MNTDDKIRAILQMEADTVDPSPAGWDAIRNGIAARRSRAWWTRGAALAGAAALVVGVTVFVAADRTPRSIREVPSTTSPSAAASPSAAPSPTPPAPVPADEPLDAIWPLTTTGEVRAWQADQETYPALRTASGSALAFARNYVGVPDARVTALEGNFGENRFEARNGDGILVTTLTVRGFGSDGTAPFVVTLARSDALTISSPARGAPVSGSLAAEGVYEAADVAIDVTLRADGSGSAPVQLAKERATAAPPNVWSAELTFTTAARTGSLLVTNGGLKDGGVVAASAVPLRFGAVSFPGPKAMVASRDGRIAVLSTATGSVVRWLTEAETDRGASGPALSDDGKTVVYAQELGECSAEIRSVPAAGGTPTTLATATEGRLHSPSRRGSTLAYARTLCREEDVTTDIVVRTPAGEDVTKADGVLVAGPVVGERFVAYVTKKDTATTLHTIDVHGELADNPVAAPEGCEWLAPAWGPRDASRRDTLWAVAGCSPRDEVYEQRLYRHDQDARDRRLVTTLDVLGGVYSLDFAGEDLVIGTASMRQGAMVWAWVGGELRQVPGQAGTPSWS